MDARWATTLGNGALLEPGGDEWQMAEMTQCWETELTRNLSQPQ